MRFVSLILVVALLLPGCVKPSGRKPKPSPDLPAVSAADWSQVKSIIKAAKDVPAAREVSEGYAGLAWALDRCDVIGNGKLKTTSQLRTGIAGFDSLMWQGTPAATKFPGLSAAINEVFKSQLGDEDRDLKPGEAAALLRELSQACKP